MQYCVEIDEPECCWDCQFCAEDEDRYFCGLDNDVNLVSVFEKRSKNCPLEYVE